MQQPTSQFIAHPTAPPSSPRSHSSKPMDPPQSGDTHDETLLQQLRLQIEYYFSPQNLSRDTFLNSLLNSRDHYGAVPVATISSFPKVKEIYASYFAGQFVPAFSAAPANPLTVGAAIRGSEVVKISADGHWLMPMCYPNVVKAGSHATSPTVSPTSFDSAHSQAVLAGPNNVVNSHAGPDQQQLQSRNAEEHPRPVAFGNAYPTSASNTFVVPYSVAGPSDPSARVVREDLRPLPHSPVFASTYANAYAPYGNIAYPMGVPNDPRMQFAGRVYMDGPAMPPSPSQIPPLSPSKANAMQAPSTSPGWTSHMMGQIPLSGNNYFGPPSQYPLFHREQQEPAPHPGRFANMDHQHMNQFAHHHRLNQENVMNEAFSHPPVYVDMSNPDSVSHYDGASLTNEQLHRYHQHKLSQQQHQGKHPTVSKNHKIHNKLDQSYNSIGSYSSNRGRKLRPINKAKGPRRNFPGPSHHGHKNVNNKVKNDSDYHGTASENENPQSNWNESCVSASSMRYDSEGNLERGYSKRDMDRHQSHGAGSYDGRRNTRMHTSHVQNKEASGDSFLDIMEPAVAQYPRLEIKDAEVANVITAASAHTPNRGKFSPGTASDGTEPKTPETVENDEILVKSATPHDLQKIQSSLCQAVMTNEPATSSLAHWQESHKAKPSPPCRLKKKLFSNKVRNSAVATPAEEESEAMVDHLRSNSQHSKNQRHVPSVRKHHAASALRVPIADGDISGDSIRANSSDSADPQSKPGGEEGEELSAFNDLSLQQHKQKMNHRYNRVPKKPFKKHHQLALPPEEFPVLERIEPDTRSEGGADFNDSQTKRTLAGSSGPGKTPRKGTASTCMENLELQSKGNEA